MKDMYFNTDEKLGFFEELVFDHYLDEDVMMIRRSGFSTAFVHITSLLAILVLVLLSF